MKPAHIGFVALALLAGSAGYAVHRHVAGSAAPPELIADERPATPAETLDWSFADLEGKHQTLAQWRGQVLVLNFWATWCPPCLREIPVFIDLQRRYADRGLQLVGIALDQAEAVRPFVTEKAVNYPVLTGDEDVVRFMQTLGNTIGGLPYTAVIGRDGQLVATHQGEWEAESAETAVAKALE